MTQEFPVTFAEATAEDFPVALEFIRNLWDYNTYDEESTRVTYEKVIADPNSFVFFARAADGSYCGMCHGDYFQTFWMNGLTCYVSSLIVRESDRGRGVGTALLDHALGLAKARGCKAATLDSGLPRTAAHAFYEHYGFEKSCYGFEIQL
ncbi:MAG: GNAT family N-acetyltransferase [Bifidobacteriaceae bacterium]|nr:GNAT family N-acetyltransferase [Bifidobacteriaceae bacterium]